MFRIESRFCREYRSWSSFRAFSEHGTKTVFFFKLQWIIIFFLVCVVYTYIHTVFWSNVPLKAVEENNFILNITLYLLDMENESLQIHGIRKMKQCAFKQYAEWKCALLQNTWNNIYLQTDLNCAHLRNTCMDNELCAFAEYAEWKWVNCSVSILPLWEYLGLSHWWNSNKYIFFFEELNNTILIFLLSKCYTIPVMTYESLRKEHCCN